MPGAERDAEGKGERRERGSMARLEGPGGPGRLRNVLSLLKATLRWRPHRSGTALLLHCSSPAPGDKPWDIWRALVLQAQQGEQQDVNRAEKSHLQCPVSALSCGHFQLFPSGNVALSKVGAGMFSLSLSCLSCLGLFAHMRPN